MWYKYKLCLSYVIGLFNYLMFVLKLFKQQNATF
jgi:hypothetical protein